MALLTGLVSYWKMDEASGTRNDSHGANHLTDINTVGSTAGQFVLAGDYVAASAEYLTRGGGITANGTSRTISLWARPDLTGTQRGVASAAVANPTSASPLWIMVQRATNVWAVFHGGNYRDSVTPTIVAGTWYHLVYTFDSGTNGVVLYINGVSRATATVADTNTGTDTYIGSGFNNAFDGLIDEVGVWNRALTSTEATDLYNAGVGLPYPLNVPSPALAAPARAAAAVGHGQLGLASGLRTFPDLLNQ